MMHLSLPSSLSPFEAVSRNLESIGAISLDAFLSNPVHARPFQDGFPEAGPSKRPTSPKTVLLEAAQQTFSSFDAIHYEYLTGGQPTSVQCIITIRRPDGISRSFKSKPYAQKSEADADAAATAIELGALQFIRTGHAPPNHGNLAPLDTPPQQNAANIPQDAITLIANCCKDWRAGLVSPDWTKLITADQHLVTTYGAALRIQLSDHVLNVYSTDAVYESYSEAQTVCAKDAVDQGVLDFIKFGNGQIKSRKSSDPVDTIMLPPQKPKQSTTTLQTFLESLPKPFPEYPDSKTVAEINPLAWLNNVTQTCRGGRVSTKFIFNSNYTIGLHGCLLRVTRPQETRSYLVDPIFHKRSDSKVAVTLLAMSQGLGDYLRSVSSEIQQQISPSVRKATVEQILPMLFSGASKIESGNQPVYEYVTDKDAFGCNLTLKYNSNGSHRQYSVEPSFATKTDAKIAVAWLAYEQGAIDLLRLRATPPPKLAKFRIKDDVVEPPPQNLGKRKEPEPSQELPTQTLTKAQHRRKRRKLARLYQDAATVAAQEDEEDEEEEGEIKSAEAMPTTKDTGKGKAKAGQKPNIPGPARTQPSQGDPQRRMGHHGGPGRTGFGGMGNSQFAEPMRGYPASGSHSRSHRP